MDKLRLLKTFLVAFSLFFVPYAINSQTQLGQDINGLSDNEWKGYSISMSDDGTRIVIGAPRKNAGYTQVYQLQNDAWVPLGDSIKGEFEGDFSGGAVDIAGNGMRIAIGAVNNDGGNGTGTGHVRIYEYSGGNWGQLGGDIDGKMLQSAFGNSVSLSQNGSRIAIGAPGYGSAFVNMGQVQIFEFNGNEWIQLGQDLNGVERFDEFGRSVAISADGSRVLIGATQNSGIDDRLGFARVYEFDGDMWQQLGIDLRGEGLGDDFGYAVSISGNGSRIAVGGRFNDAENMQSAGHIRIYEYSNGGVWEQIGEDIDGEGAFEQFGWSVALSSDGTKVVGGARNKDTDSGEDSGRIRVFEYLNDKWTQIGSSIDGKAEDDNFGWSVAISGDGNRFAGGGHRSDNDIWFEAGNVRVYEFMTLSSFPDITERGYITIYPNPFLNDLWLGSNDDQNYFYRVFNMNGQLQMSGDNKHIETTNLPDGIYFISIQDRKGTFLVEKVIKQSQK